MSKTQHSWAFGITIVIGTLFLLVAPFYAFRSYERSSLIQYQGTIVDASVDRGLYRSTRLGLSVDVKILYDGSHLETHEINTSLNRAKLRAILEHLKEAKGETVRVRFLSDDRTLAEIVKLDGEVILPLSQVKEAGQFTAIGMGTAGFFLLGGSLIGLVLSERKRANDA